MYQRTAKQYEYAAQTYVPLSFREIVQIETGATPYPPFLVVENIVGALRVSADD